MMPAIFSGTVNGSISTLRSISNLSKTQKVTLVALLVIAGTAVAEANICWQSGSKETMCRLCNRLENMAELVNHGFGEQITASLENGMTSTEFFDKLIQACRGSDVVSSAASLIPSLKLMIGSLLASLIGYRILN